MCTPYGLKLRVATPCNVDHDSKFRLPSRKVTLVALHLYFRVGSYILTSTEPNVIGISCNGAVHCLREAACSLCLLLRHYIRCTGHPLGRRPTRRGHALSVVLQGFIIHTALF